MTKKDVILSYVATYLMAVDPFTPRDRCISHFETFALCNIIGAHQTYIRLTHMTNNLTLRRAEMKYTHIYQAKYVLSVVLTEVNINNKYDET